MSKKPLRISDHAVLRFVERCMLIDPEKIRKQIKDKLEPVYKSLGDGEYPITEDHTARVKGGVVVTILKKNGEK